MNSNGDDLTAAEKLMLLQLPDEVFAVTTLEEGKIMVRKPIAEWPEDLRKKVSEFVDLEDE